MKTRLFSALLALCFIQAVCADEPGPEPDVRQHKPRKAAVAKDVDLGDPRWVSPAPLTAGHADCQVWGTVLSIDRYTKQGEQSQLVAVVRVMRAEVLDPAVSAGADCRTLKGGLIEARGPFPSQSSLQHAAHGNVVSFIRRTDSFGPVWALSEITVKPFDRKPVSEEPRLVIR